MTTAPSPDEGASSSRGGSPTAGSPSPDDAARFILYEAYATAEDAAAHKRTPHYFRWRDAVAGMMAEPRRGEPWRGLFPA